MFAELTDELLDLQASEAGPDPLLADCDGNVNSVCVTLCCFGCCSCSMMLVE